MHLRLSLDNEGEGWYFDIDFERDIQDDGPGYFLWFRPPSDWWGDWSLGDKFVRPMTPWEGVVLCVKKKNSQAPVKAKYRKKL